jgi:tetratricopeptide (TPR) repeat protein
MTANLQIEQLYAIPENPLTCQGVKPLENCAAVPNPILLRTPDLMLMWPTYSIAKTRNAYRPIRKPAILAAIAVAPAFALPPEPTAPAPPAPLLSDARELYMSGKYEEAIGAFEALVREPARAVEAAVGLAKCRMQVGEYDAAQTDLESAAAQLDRADGKVSASWHYELAALHEIKGRYDLAIASARRAIELRGDHAGARRLIGRIEELLGRRDAAVETYRWFDQEITRREELPRDPEWITHAAVGFLRYSTLTRTNLASRTRHALNGMLQIAYERLDRTYWPARLVAADLLREKHNHDETDGSLSDYRAALSLNENLPRAYVGIGEIALESWQFEEVEHHAEMALAVNPNLAVAFHLLARKSIVERRYELAVEHTLRALDVNPNDVIALSIKAAAHACRFDQAALDETRKRVDAITPTCPILHRTLGDALSGIRQYRDSEREYLQAIKLDPTDANARNELGMMYMQWGPEDKAREALEAAWELDPFNEKTTFTLELLETLHKFDRVESPHFIVKFDAAHDPGLGRFVLDYLEEVYASVTGDYDTPTSEKTIIEIFPTHRQFGVRITGRPWIHTVGACTGRVIALASPRDRAGLGAYNIGRVLKHEFTHTVTLEATRNRIPHWFTEGLAVYQEDAPRTFAWCELLADAARRDHLFTVASIDWGFIRPQRPNDRQMAYAQSEWMCEYIVDRFGYSVINDMLERYHAGDRQDAVFSERLGVSVDAFDRDFQDWARMQVEEWGFDLTPPESVEALIQLADAERAEAAIFARLARAVFDAGDLERARSAAKKALQIDPDHAAALRITAEILYATVREAARQGASGAGRQSLDEEALPILERLIKTEPAAWIGPKFLGEIMLRRDNHDRAFMLFTNLQQICPMDPASWRALAGIHLKRGEEDKALPQLVELARMEETDADIAARIASILRKQERFREAIYWYRQALFADPFNIDVHNALGETALLVDDNEAALRRFDFAARLEPRNPRHFEKAAFAAHKLGRKDEAARFARTAVELDPNSSARSLLP